MQEWSERHRQRETSTHALSSQPLRGRIPSTAPPWTTTWHRSSLEGGLAERWYSSQPTRSGWMALLASCISASLMIITSFNVVIKYRAINYLNNTIQNFKSTISESQFESYWRMASLLCLLKCLQTPSVYLGLLNSYERDFKIFLFQRIFISGNSITQSSFTFLESS